jgi:hypothetical protein
MGLFLKYAQMTTTITTDTIAAAKFMGKIKKSPTHAELGTSRDQIKAGKPPADLKRFLPPFVTIVCRACPRGVANRPLSISGMRS